MVPPGMGPAEYAAYCRTKADPAELQAIRDWAHQKFGPQTRSKDGVQPSRRPPNSHVTSDRNETVIGLLSPGASEHSQPKNTNKNNRNTFRAIRPRQIAPLILKTPSCPILDQVAKGKVKKQTSLRKGSERASKDRKQSKATARMTRSKVEAVTIFLQLDASGKKAIEATSKNLSIETEALNDSTKPPVSKSNGVNKRRRDDESEPERKRTKIEARPKGLNVLQPDPSHDSLGSLPLIEEWLNKQKGDYEPMETASVGIGSDLLEPSIQHISKHQISCNSNKPTTKPRLEKDVTVEPFRTGLRPTKHLEAAQSMEVTNILCAYQATNAYCKALGLDQEIAETAKVPLHKIFYNDAFKGFSKHYLIAGCILLACDENKIRCQAADFFPPEAVRLERGRTILALWNFFASPEGTKIGI